MLGGFPTKGVLGPPVTGRVGRAPRPRGGRWSPPRAAGESGAERILACPCAGALAGCCCHWAHPSPAGGGPAPRGLPRARRRALRCPRAPSLVRAAPAPQALAAVPAAGRGGWGGVGEARALGTPPWGSDPPRPALPETPTLGGWGGGRDPGGDYQPRGGWGGAGAHRGGTLELSPWGWAGFPG